MPDRSTPPRPGSATGATPATLASLPGGIGHESGDLHRLLVESVRDYAIFALDVDGHILSWNAGAEHFKGYTADEVIGRHFSIFYPRERVEEQFPQFELREAARLGRFEDEGWRVRKDGTRFWANVVITALRDSGGTLIGYAKVTRDLSERRRADEALRLSEERFRLLVEGVRDYAIFMLDPTGHVATWNAGAERFNGYRADEIIGRHFSLFYGAEDQGKPAMELEVASRTGSYEEEGWRVRKDGTRFWASVLITALRDSTDRLVGFGKVTRDLTERREAEARELADARRVAEAEAANRAKVSFLAAMSHELRTPLNAIGGYVDLITLGLRGPVTDEQQQDLTRIKRGQQHLLTVINDILNFSRIEAGQLRYDIRAVSLAQVTDAVGQLVLPQVIARQLTLDLRALAGAEDLLVYADPSKLEQVVLNLLSNAIKFTEPGGAITVAVETRGERVALIVRDTGIGIASDDLEAIFEPFRQVGRTLSSSHEGTGLGLAISRDLARAMDGDLVADSEVGTGSSFTLTLPRAPR